MNAYKVTSTTGTEFVVMAASKRDAIATGNSILADGDHYVGLEIWQVASL